MSIIASSIFTPTPLRVVCAWCGTTMQPGREPVSHGICLPCAAQFRNSMRRPVQEAKR